MVLSTPQGGSTSIKQQYTLLNLKGGITMMKSKWLAVNPNHHINQIKLVSGQPTKTPDIMKNHWRIEESKNSSSDPFHILLTLHLTWGISMMIVRLQFLKSYQSKFGNSNIATSILNKPSKIQSTSSNQPIWEDLAWNLEPIIAFQLFIGMLFDT